MSRRTLAAVLRRWQPTLEWIAVILFTVLMVIVIYLQAMTGRVDLL